MTGDADDFDLPSVEDDAASTGAAADSSDLDDRLSALPRLLRYAMLVSKDTGRIEERLVAEISRLRPGLPQNVAWAIAKSPDTGLVLAAELDRLAVTDDEPVLRSLADCVRLLCLPVPRDSASFDEYRRVGKALMEAFRNAERRSSDQQLCSELEEFAYGWAALPACTERLSEYLTAASNAAILGPKMAAYRIAVAKAAVRLELKEEEEYREEQDAKMMPAEQQEAAAPEGGLENHIVVARLSTEEMKNTKLKDILGPLKGVINVALPLVEVPPLHHVRNTLLFEFPYAMEVIDFVLADLVGRVTVKLRPLIFVGDSGGGKTRFARRLAEELLGLDRAWRTDASRADGAVFGGTDRRWHSAEPSHPFLAIAKTKIANPIVLIDEIEKAATRSDYGRLWDCLLGFLEPETSARHPDPALLVAVNLAHVSYIATANSLDYLPSPLVDRMRVVRFPKPSADDIDALLPAVMTDLARERGLDNRWVRPLDGIEHAAVAREWRGGSVRRLRRIVEAILRHREARTRRN